MMNKYQEDLLEVSASPLPWQRLTGKNVLVVGATGLIGGAVVDVLMRRQPLDFDVYACGRNEERARRRFAGWWSNPRFHFLRHDITLPWQEDVDFHFVIDAASGYRPSYMSLIPLVSSVPTSSADRLLDSGRRHGMEKFVYVSSGEVYGEGDGRAFSEDYSGYVDPMSVRSCYPSSKRAAETLCVAYAKEYGIDVSVARPSHVYGRLFHGRRQACICRVHTQCPWR